MSSYKALLAYEQVLREFQNRLSRETYDYPGKVEAGFGFLCQRLNLTNISLFDWVPKKRALVMRYMFQNGILMEGESEIPVGQYSDIAPLVQDRVPVVVSKKKPWTAYVPLWTDNTLMGAIRIERKIALPKGTLLQSLPRFNSPSENRDTRFPLLQDIADILADELQWLKREADHQNRAQYLRAGSEVAAAVVETPRLKEMLEAVGRSIVKNLGFDRIRFYLVDPGRSELRGVLGLQIPDRLINLEGEKYPLRPYENSLVDAVLDGKTEMKFVSAGGKVVYVPLIVGGQIAGCVAVDNLLSQVVINQEQMATLRSLAGSIGMAVLNARLFEDIEQQAITDGLTNLYVYRYFQQRLKEEIDRADRYSYGVALVMMDVDNFKTFNDNYGHAVGDRVLEFLSQAIRSNIRRIDLASRYGGDEFILLLPEITEQEAWLMGTRLMNAIRQSTVKSSDGRDISVGVTMGIAMYPNDAKNGRDLMESADKALYWAKNNGRGDICIYRNISDKIEKTL